MGHLGSIIGIFILTTEILMRVLFSLAFYDGDSEPPNVSLSDHRCVATAVHLVDVKEVKGEQEEGEEEEGEEEEK